MQRSALCTPSAVAATINRGMRSLAISQGDERPTLGCLFIAALLDPRPAVSLALSPMLVDVLALQIAGAGHGRSTGRRPQICGRPPAATGADPPCAKSSRTGSSAGALVLHWFTPI